MAAKLWPDALAKGTINVLLLDHAGMTAANLRVFEKNTTTDVITVVYTADAPDDSPSGDILINAELALEEGRRRTGPDHELALYLAHGLDHLHGADDRTPSQRARMRRRELAWLREARALGLLNRLCEPR